MSYNVILFKTPENTLGVCIPSPDGIEFHGSIINVAHSDIPAGSKFKIMLNTDLPSAPMNQWVVNDADLNDGIAGEP